MIQELKYNGITTVPSDYECPDGDMSGMINAVIEDGVVRPLCPPKSIYTPPSGFTVKYIHKVNNGERTNYILIEDNTLYWYDSEETDEDKQYKSIKDILKIKSVNAIGNTLVVIADEGMHYILWKADTQEYRYLGTQIPDLSMSFGLQGHVRFYSVSREDGKEFGFDGAYYRTGYFEVNYDEIPDDKRFEKFSDNNKRTITDQVLAKVNLFISQQTVEKGRFCFPFFVRYALRLYDGTLVNHSAPILMMPSTDICPIVTVESWSKTKCELDIMMVASDIDYRILPTTESSALFDGWGDIVKDVEIYISKPIYTYDQNGNCESFDNSGFPKSSFIGMPVINGYTNEKKEDYLFSNTETDKEMVEKYYEWEYRHLFSLYNSGMKTFIEDYVSDNPEIGETDRIVYRFYRQNPSSVTIRLPRKNETDILKDITESSNFYLLKSIPIKDIDLTKQNISTKIEISDSYLQSLTSRQVMTDDYLSHDKKIPSYSFAFNSRLNIANIKRELYKGYNPCSMFSRCEGNYQWIDNYNDKTDDEIYNKPSFAIGEVIFPLVSDLQYWLYVDTYIKDNNGVRVVYTKYDGSVFSSSIRKFCTDESVTKTWGNYVFYPNTNAYKMVISDDDGNRYDINLKPHDFLNGAFAYLGNHQERIPSQGVLEDIATTNPIVSDPNKVYTSEINNPFYFPVTGINTIGTGKILGISSAVKALSQGQFGQFPMYVFTTDGVWALETSASGTFNAKQPVTRDVCICPESITQVDGAVLFATDRGIMMLQGSTATCISLDLDKDAQDLTAFPQLIELLNKHQYPIPSVDSNFKEYAQDCRMVYDYVNQRIIVANPIATYAYVYSMKSNTWGMIESTIADSINSYPEAYAVDKNGALIDFSHPKIKDVKATLVTRPIKFDAPNDLKTIRTIVQRGMIERRDVKFVLYGSRDLVNWYALASTTTSFLKGISGTPYKYFRLAIMADLKEDKSIYGATIDVEPKYNNRIR